MYICTYIYIYRYIYRLTPKGCSGTLQKSSFLIYFRASGVSPIDPARRELRNAIGEIEIEDFLIFDAF